MPEGNARFPGFIGPEFEPGHGVLAWDTSTATCPRLTTLPAVGSTMSRQRFCNGVPRQVLRRRRAVTHRIDSGYLASAPTWDYWKKNYGKLLSQGHVPITQVAFANVAKCRTATEEPSSASAKLAKACSKVYPPAELIAVLQPAVILLASLTLEPGDVGDARLIQWNGRTGTDVDGNRMTDWIEIQSNRLHEARPTA